MRGEDREAAADEQAVDGTPDERATLLGLRVEYLFTCIQPLGRRYTLQEVVDGIRQITSGPNALRLSAGQLWSLVNGRVANPAVGSLRALGAFFGVPLAYFVDDEVAARVSARLALAAALRANDVRSVALRAATVAAVSAQGVEAVRSVLDLRGGAGTEDAP
ncbi:hypothetical protein [Streptomyces bambusae]|uniref:XRE family transcriptional regulator n=1 Tax=Streptomyces bambusae TaxID=1550616 RepID=A0ABS6YZT0_9ACTN|nr:hypothetical protein [Streptomyces bambusae]MBW5480979.1 hypothetical protein [Streptomyces bambusae]